MVSLITLPDDILAAVLQEAFHCNDSSTSDFPYVLSLLAVCRRLRTFAILAAYRTVFVKYNESACHGRYDRALPASELANPSFRTNLGLVASAGCAQVVRHVNIEVDFSGFPIHGFGKTVQLMRIVSPAWKGVRSLKLDIVTGDRAYDDTPSSLDANADTFQEIDQDLATVLPNVRHLAFGRINQAPSRRRQPKDRRVLWFPVLEHFRLWNWTRYCPFLGQAKFPSELKSMSIDASPSAQTCVDAVIEVIPRLPNLVNLVLGRLELEGTQMDISAPGPGEPAPSPLSTTLRTLSIVFHNWWHVSEQAVPLIQYLLLRTPALAKLTLDPPPPVQPLAEFFAEYSARYPSLARARMRGPNTDPFWSTFEVLARMRWLHSLSGARRWRRPLGGLCLAAAAGGYVYDRQLQASAVARTLRAFWLIGTMSLDYKINFREGCSAEELGRVHARAARRLLACCQENGGLFIKFGQSIAVQSALLPPAFRRELSVLYDSAPSVPVERIAAVIERGFQGRTIDDVFAEFSPEAVASASVAQVHRARLRSDPAQVVAVKVQKPEIQLQIGWDLFALRTCARLVEYAFEIPIMWSVAEVERRLREELDFEREANNSELAARDIARLGDRQMRRSVYIPRVVWEATHREVLTTEWIDGTSLVHPRELEAKGWSPRDVMQRMAALFAFQIFVTGNVHGDPHPGNILVRQNPHATRRREPQLVLLDHGLYVRQSRAFRRQYAEFWRAAMLGDRATMSRIARAWGMADAGMLSTMVSLKPPQLGPRRRSRQAQDPDASGGQFDRQMELKARAVAALRDSHSLPPELVFVTRNMNIVRANNQSLGTPVNRVQILGHYAALGLRAMLLEDALGPGRRYSQAHGVEPARATLASRALAAVAAEWSFATFRAVLWASGVAAAVWRLCGRAWALLSGRPVRAAADAVLDDAMRAALEKRLGYRIDTSLLSA
ncbi:hypothetical protein H4R18_001394 [Coemansia javaensis]|uniref:ABC1 atypical kinase-like domain-containing protein n=1 Tax=Coemansia javaensis TaxID=2761396 RepID=A0A9W8HKT5_9FUNG|nr:hypothetical protein H4R18_001394 [Coemansia javaensis]